jgi:hypothetical protein
MNPGQANPDGEPGPARQGDLEEPREWLATADGRIIRVRTMPALADHAGGVGELVPWASPRAHPVSLPTCACGAPRRHGAQSCGAKECVARLWQDL